MARGRALYVVIALALLGDAFSLPTVVRLPRTGLDTHKSPGQGLKTNNELGSNTEAAKSGRLRRSAAGLNGVEANDLDPAGSDNRVARDDSNPPFTSDNENGESKVQTTTMKPEYATPVDDDSDEDDDFEPMNTAPSAGGGSNIFSLLRLANALFPSSSSSGNTFLLNMLRRYFNNPILLNGLVPTQAQTFNPTFLLRRQDVDVSENRVDTEQISGLKPPPLQKQETQEDSDDNDDSNDESDESDENNAAESVEDNGNSGNGNGNGNASKQKSGSEEDGKESEDDDNDSDYDEPEGDGQGGGILGILAGLSGGPDGESDLGSLLAAVSGIVANLSGDGFDLNALIASGLGLFVGLLSNGEENPGQVIASYLLTSLDTITGGGAQNNGAFFGKFLAKLLRGVSAGGDPDVSLEEGQEPPKDSVSFFKSLLMGLLGEMSKSSNGSSCSGSCGWQEEPAPA
ncbi:hypothetical protein O0L34_g15088 [Tuta absoluta]|nr:hypothetical protein O0L34_g15088 [Tuta absoluta]